MINKSVKSIVIGLLGSACATSYQPSYSYNEILVVNNSRELVQDVTIEVVDVPAYLYAGIALIGVLEITPGGAVRAYFDQNTSPD